MPRGCRFLIPHLHPISSAFYRFRTVLFLFEVSREREGMLKFTNFVEKFIGFSCSNKVKEDLLEAQVLVRQTFFIKTYWFSRFFTIFLLVMRKVKLSNVFLLKFRYIDKERSSGVRFYECVINFQVISVPHNVSDVVRMC